MGSLCTTSVPRSLRLASTRAEALNSPSAPVRTTASTTGLCPERSTTRRSRTPASPLPPGRALGQAPLEVGDALLEQQERCGGGVVGRRLARGVGVDRLLDPGGRQELEQRAGGAAGLRRDIGADGVRERRRALVRRGGVAGDEDAQRADRPRRREPAQHRPVDERIAALRRERAGRRAAHDGGRVGGAVVVPALADRHGLLAAHDLRVPPQRELVVPDAPGDEVRVTRTAGGRHEAERRRDVLRRALGDAGRVGGWADEDVVAVEHEPARRLERPSRGDEGVAGLLAVGERELGLARAQVGERAHAVAAHPVHGDAVAARDGHEHGAHESRLGERRRTFDGHAGRAAASARRRGQGGRDEQAGEQASHAPTVRAGAARVKAGTSSVGAMAPRVRDDLPHPVRVVETEWIPLADGSRLAARLWLPEGAGRVPAILEYLPYRLSDGTQAGDHQQMTLVRRARLRRRPRRHPRHRRTRTASSRTSTPSRSSSTASRSSPGSPRSRGATGKVGMMGYSWSGFNGLQVAALQPPALRAIASLLRLATTATPTTCTTAAGS